MNLLPRLILCGLSVVLLATLGLLGDGLPHLVRAGIPSKCGLAADMPYPTLLALNIFGVNKGNFALSLTPFMIVFGGLAACMRGESRLNLFWSAFAGTWLLALIYFGLYIWALSLPFHFMCADFNDYAIEWIVPAINVVLLTVAVIVFWRGRRAQ